MIFLLADANSATQWILPAVLLVLVIGIFVLNYFRSKKNNENVKNMVDSLKVGDNVKTYSGLYGKIIEIVETTDGKVAILETGSEKNKGIFSIDINAIYGIDQKAPVTYDANGNVIDPDAPIEETKKEEPAVATEKIKEGPKKKAKKSKEETPIEEVKIEPVEEVKVEPVEEVKKPATKKSK